MFPKSRIKAAEKSIIRRLVTGKIDFVKYNDINNEIFSLLQISL